MKRSSPKARMPFPHHKLIIVWWWDAVGARVHPNQVDIADLQLAENFSVGWLLHETADRIVLCSGSGTTDEAETLQIPIPNIIRWKTILLAKRKCRKK